MWVAALKSGAYKQGTGVLHRKGKGFDCLGVLADLYAKEKKIADPWREKETPRGQECPFCIGGEHHYFSALPDFVVKWAGLTRRDPKVGRYTLSVINDGCEFLGIKRMSFEKIGDIVAKKL